MTASGGNWAAGAANDCWHPRAWGAAWERSRGQRLPAGGTRWRCWGPWHGTWCATPSMSTLERMDLSSQAACCAFYSAEPSLESSASSWLKSPLSKEREPKLAPHKGPGCQPREPGAANGTQQLASSIHTSLLPFEFRALLKPHLIGMGIPVEESSHIPSHSPLAPGLGEAPRTPFPQ